MRSNAGWGGGALFDIGCYAITMSRWMFAEEPTEVFAQLENDPDFGVDRFCSALMRFPSGQAMFSVAGQLALHQAFQLFGTKGRIALDVPFNPPADYAARLVIDDGRDLIGGGAEVMTFAPVNRFTLQATRFAEAVRGVNTVAVPQEDAVLNMRVIDALFRSAEARRWETP